MPAATRSTPPPRPARRRRPLRLPVAGALRFSGWRAGCRCRGVNNGGEPTMLQRTHRAATPTTTMAKPGAALDAAGRKGSSKVSSLIYLPALLVPAIAVLLIGAGWANRWGGVDFGASLTSLRVET